MNDIQIIAQEAELHKGMATAFGLWFMREIPVLYRWIVGTVWPWLATKVWPAIVSVYPYCIINGGVFGVVRSFFIGKGGETKISPVVAIAFFILFVAALVLAAIVYGGLVAHSMSVQN